MLITQLKDKEFLAGLASGKVFIINCHGCKEVYFPEEAAKEFQQALLEAGKVTGMVTADYICNPEYLNARLDKHQAEIDAADTILVFACGVGVQTIAAAFANKKVCACCDTYPLPGFQGVTPLEHKCNQCGECFLNITGGICPLTACSKSLVNGQCGGAKNGMCEVDPSMECGWERIQKKLAQVGRLDALKCPVQIRNYATDDEV